MKCVIRTVASKEKGTGHLMRCLALAQELDQQYIDVTFLINEEAAKIAKARHDWTGKIKIVPEHSCLEQEFKWLTGQECVNDCEAIVIDGYDYGVDYVTGISGLGKLMVMFDDNNDRGLFEDVDVVINGDESFSEADYRACFPNASFCLGRHFRILRQEFNYQPEVTWQQRDSLTLVLGGSDPKGYTLPLVDAIAKLDNQLPMRVVTGAAYTQVQELDFKISELLNPIQHLHQCQEIADLFRRSRLVVSAAGSTQFELLACATPAFLITVADNQRHLAENEATKGWCQWIDGRHSLDFSEVASRVIPLFHNDEQLQQMHRVSQDNAILDGAQSVVDHICDRLKMR